MQLRSIRCVLVLLTSCVAVAGCGSGADEAAPPRVPAETSAAAPPAPAPPAPASPAAAPVHAGGRTYALVRVAGSVEECSNLGGAHYVLDVMVPGAGVPATVHSGTHGSRAVRRVGELYLAELLPLGPAAERGRSAGWCLDGLPPTDARLISLVHDESQGAALLARLAAGASPASL